MNSWKNKYYIYKANLIIGYGIYVEKDVLIPNRKYWPCCIYIILGSESRLVPWDWLLKKQTLNSCSSTFPRWWPD